jgi:predicted transcriptional regulator
MNRKKLTYIEDSGILFEQLGMTRMAGRVFGLLIVSDSDSLSFDQICEILDASKGSISGTTKQLTQSGLIRPITLPGDRKTYYRITEMELGDLIKSKMQMFEKLSGLLDSGRMLKEKDDELSVWLLEASTFYSWIGDEMDKVINKWHKEKESIIQTFQKEQNHELEQQP